VVTLGTFDGVHLGHQALVERALAKAREIGGTAVLLTLEPHPRRLIDPGFELARLTLPAERAELLAALGLDALVEQAFTADFAQTSSLDFVRRDLVGHLGMKHLIVGYDHRFGRNREGDFAQLQEFAGVFDFGLDRVDAVMGDRDALSSTKNSGSRSRRSRARRRACIGQTAFRARGSRCRARNRPKSGLPYRQFGRNPPRQGHAFVWGVRRGA
jgi:riboflavin kinase / FMN adenylyltransferase